VAEVEFS